MGEVFSDMKQNNHQKIAYLEKAASIFCAVLVWQMVAMAIHQRVLLATPFEVVKSLCVMWKEAESWQAVLFSVGHFMQGFLLAFVSGILLASLSAKVHIAEVFLWPYMQVVKATPVASFIILCLVWFPVKKLSVVISFLMVLPVVYHNFLAGIRSFDKKKTEMGKINRVPLRIRFFAYVLPQLKAAVTSSCEAGLAMAFKAGTAAEVIGTPAGSIGRMLYQAKIYLCTADLMAWTVVIVVCSVILEKVLKVLIKLLYGNLERICLKL